MELKEKAAAMIDRLRQHYSANRFEFDAVILQYLEGDRNKELRREVIRQTTGERRPLTKCGPYMVSDCLKAKFEQPELFIK